MYFTPHLDETGVRIPTYEDRLDALTASYQAIFGSGANLEISSPDYQLLSVFARALDDLSQLILDDFASRNPRYAAGAALDLLMPLMGLTRQGATCSKAILTLTGAPVTILSAAPEVLDDAGHLWRCRSAGILLDTQGKASVEAVCTTPGAVEAPAGSIHRLVSPIAGLASAVNLAAATPGREAESDASCRRRLQNAAAAPARSTLEALRSAVLSVPNVSDCAVYENDSDAEDERGIPGHSLCAVVSGGLTSDLAPVIFKKKAPGIGTHGAVSATVEDAWGGAHMVKFQRAAMTPVALSIEIKALAGYDSAIEGRIREALVSHISSLGIGQELVVPALYGLCYAQDPGPAPTFAITLLSASAQGASTSGVLPAAWNQRLTTQPSMIQILVH